MTKKHNQWSLQYQLTSTEGWVYIYCFIKISSLCMPLTKTEWRLPLLKKVELEILKPELYYSPIPQEKKSL